MSIIVGSSILFTSYLLISRIVIYNSDDASIILEAQSMLHGNYILRGWYMPADNFLTIEIPLYTLGCLLGFHVETVDSAAIEIRRPNKLVLIVNRGCVGRKKRRSEQRPHGHRRGHARNTHGSRIRQNKRRCVRRDGR